MSEVSSLEIHRLAERAAVGQGPPAALELLRNFANVVAASADLLTLEGRLLVATGQLENAKKSFERAVIKAPEEPQFRANLATVLLKTERPDLAYLQIVEARKRLPRDAGFLKTELEILTAMGRSETVIDLLETAISTGLDEPAVRLDLARALQELGERDKAAKEFEAVLETGHYTSGALFGLAQTADNPERISQQVDAMVASSASDIALDDKVRLLHAKGISEDQMGHYETSFDAFKQARKLSFEGRREARDFERSAEQMVAEMDQSWFHERRNWGVSSTRPVFVVGMPRSGTTLVEHILSSHPQVHGAGELGFFRYQEQLLKRSKLGRSAVKEVARDYLKLLRSLGGSSVKVVDKMPLNATRLWLISLTFPKALIVHCERDPVATGVSLLTSPMGKSNGFLRSQGDLARYSRSVEQLMLHWKNVLPNPIYTVNYEKFVSFPDDEIRSLVETTGLGWDEKCLTFHTNSRSVRTPSRDQVSRPINQDGLKKWKRFEPFIEPLLSGLAWR